MSSEAERLMGDIQLDGINLYREENITDLKVGSIRVLTPIKVDGSADGTRNALYMGQTQLVSQMGPLPVSCEIDASSLQDAVEKFPAAMKLAVEKMIEEVKEMQREQASQIVVPGAAPPRQHPAEIAFPLVLDGPLPTLTAQLFHRCFTRPGCAPAGRCELDKKAPEVVHHPFGSNVGISQSVQPRRHIGAPHAGAA